MFCISFCSIGDVSTNASRRHLDALQSAHAPSVADPQTAHYNDTGLDDSGISSIQMSSGPGYTSSGLADFQPPADPGGRRQSNLSEGHIPPRSDSLMGISSNERGRNTQRGAAQRSRGAHQDAGHTNIPSNIMNDRFDHYNRPSSRATSRDRSMDRFASRGTTPVPQELVNTRSRAPSQQRYAAPDCTPDSGVFEDDLTSTVIPGTSRRPSRPTSVISGDGLPLTGNGSIGGSFNIPYHIPNNQKEAETLLKQRACGQFIPQPPAGANICGGSVKRTESLYINPVIRQQQQHQQQQQVKVR